MPDPIEPNAPVAAVVGAPAAEPAKPAEPAAAVISEPAAEPAKPEEGKSVLDTDGKTPEEKAAAEAAAKAEAAAAEVKLEELKLPEGFKMEEATAAALKEILGDKALSAQDRMQKLTDIHTGLLKTHAETQLKAWNDIQEKWVGEIKADPEMGGPKFQVMQATVSKALDQFGTPNVRKALTLTGAGNNPDVVKTFFKMSQALVEAGAVPAAKPAAQPKTAADIMWPQQGT